ncbi:hypothetical protein CSE16_14910 [Solibacillus sp. R5-41]|uniref:DUF2642 domain-containing protein n=1 Tax=Solibacillus sp. R5-41 TaxID=2048654 RepID=UPI000C129693|nr:DUF2642 domain-containing protein [Solibacillus sp. R5-41]ATP41240.1 hypothetical protein CSE16_14910 [Solibacillus sp. R5-41]
MVQPGNFPNYYLLDALQSYLGKMVAVQQTGNHVQQGILTSICPDYITLDVYGVPFFIRIEQVVWVNPLTRT